MIVDRVDELCRPCQALGFAQQSVAETEVEAEVGAEPAVAVACKAGACEQGHARFEVEVEILLYVDTGLDCGSKANFVTPGATVANTLVFCAESSISSTLREGL